MSVTQEAQSNSHICIGILAHVDAGKTTLSESLLYLSKEIPSLGRVDKGDAFLDTAALERERGITIFSKQAELSIGSWQVSLLDTPGHVDFSAEMERTLQVLDYGILVISAADGIQGHTCTLWKLLERYGIPVFLFINKMDQPEADREHLMQELQTRLDSGCLDFATDSAGILSADCLEAIAEKGEEALVEEYLNTDTLKPSSIAAAIRERKVFPCYFGSALRLEGVDALMEGIRRYVCPKCYDKEFGARVYKITRDDKGNRLTHMKLTGGSLKVKERICHNGIEEKADQIRIYSGSKFRTVENVQAGMVCAVTGLEHSYCGEGIGKEKEAELPVLEPVLQYRVSLPENCDSYQARKQLKELEEENPMLRLVWKEETGELQIQLMGEVEMEILRSVIRERFGLTVDFLEGCLVYKETLEEPVVGVGHYEPLRHYAEVHLLMEPGEPGSGIQIENLCREEQLGRNWQQQIISCLEHESYPGVLTGSEITDMKITLLAGKAHLKHTEGGDFRQAVRRAIRQGLMKAGCRLLEPVYVFRLELPLVNSGRAMSDIQRMCGTIINHEPEGDMVILTGQAPVSTMSGYSLEVNAYTGGRGKLFCSIKGYMPCHDPETVIERFGYQPEQDLENPAGSVFCMHGAGTNIPWNQVEEYMHVKEVKGPYFPNRKERGEQPEEPPAKRPVRQGTGNRTEDEVLAEIFYNTYGEGKKRVQGKQEYDAERPVSTEKKRKPVPQKEQYLLVDGYNVVYAWEELKELAKDNLDAARTGLAERLCNYQGYRKRKVMLIFDAYQVPGNKGKEFDYQNIRVVYTKEGQTADQYIEKMVYEYGKIYDIIVATSDKAEQTNIWGSGARRLSARELKLEIERTEQEIRELYLEKQN